MFNFNLANIINMFNFNFIIYTLCCNNENIHGSANRLIWNKPYTNTIMKYSYIINHHYLMRPVSDKIVPTGYASFLVSLQL